MKTSLEKFMDLVNNQFPQMKKYIVSESEHYIILEDHNGNCVFGTNDDLTPLFEQHNPFPIKNLSASYKEKDGYFIINIELK